MPNRQVILYDKAKAARDLKTEYWFSAWGIDPQDFATQIWRAEIRFGREGFKRYVRAPLRRNYKTVEALLPQMLKDAASEIRYAPNRGEVSNVTRSKTHPLWSTAQQALKALPMGNKPPLTPAYVLELMRKQRVIMAEAQGFGNLNNLLVLEGYSPGYALENYPRLATEMANSYRKTLGYELHLTKLGKSKERLEIFLPCNSDNSLSRLQ